MGKPMHKMATGVIAVVGRRSARKLQIALLRNDQTDNLNALVELGNSSGHDALQLCLKVKALEW
jgi:hypothetical protein